MQAILFLYNEHWFLQQTHLNADVPPFVPRKDYQYDQHVQEQGGGASLPRYLTTCYPFVQEQQDRRWWIFFKFTIFDI